MPKVIQVLETPTTEHSNGWTTIIGDDGSVWERPYSHDGKWGRLPLPDHFAPAAPPVPAPTKDCACFGTTGGTLSHDPACPNAEPSPRNGEAAHFICPDCGLHVAADEDGCCAQCGRDTVQGPCGKACDTPTSQAAPTKDEAIPLTVRMDPTTGEPLFEPPPAQAVTEVTGNWERVGLLWDELEQLTGAAAEKTWLKRILDEAEQRGAAKALPADASEALREWNAAPAAWRDAVLNDLAGPMAFSLPGRTAARLLRALAKPSEGTGT